LDTNAVDKTVWVDGWQLQCCGRSFTIGSTVTWTVDDPDTEWLTTVLGPDITATIDAAEDHHTDAGPDKVTLTGTVRSIKTVHCRYAPDPDSAPRTLYPVPSSGIATDVRRADGLTPDQDGLRFAGYLVHLDHSP
jgi:hypothetical protein